MKEKLFKHYFFWIFPLYRWIYNCKAYFHISFSSVLQGIYSLAMPKSILISDLNILHPSGCLYLLESHMQFPSVFTNTWRLISFCIKVSCKTLDCSGLCELCIFGSLRGNFTESRPDIIRDHHLAISPIVF